MRQMMDCCTASPSYIDSEMMVVKKKTLFKEDHYPVKFLLIINKTAMVKKICVQEASTSLSNSLMIGIYPAASAWRHVIMSPSYKKIICLKLSSISNLNLLWIQIMDWHSFGSEPLSEPVLASNQLDPSEFQWKCNIFHPQDAFENFACKMLVILSSHSRFTLLMLKLVYSVR